MNYRDLYKNTSALKNSSARKTQSAGAFEAQYNPRNDWLKSIGFKGGSNDAVNFLRHFATPGLSQQYMDDLGYYRSQTGARRDRQQGFYDQLGKGADYSGMQGDLQKQIAYLQQMQPGYQQNTQNMIQSGGNLARQANVGNRMGSANSFGRGLENQATEAGQAQAAQFRRMGLGDAAQAGAIAQQQAQARMGGAQARLGAMSPQASMDAARQASMGYGQIGDAYRGANALGDQMGGIMQMMAGLDQAQLQNLLARMQGVGQLDQNQLASVAENPLIGLSNLFSGYQQVKNTKPKTDWGGLFGGVAAGLASNPAVFACDRRLKRNVERIGSTDAGLPLYTFQYKDSDQWHIGPMAQDVERLQPSASGPEVGGYKTVLVKEIR